jgi:Sulfotransferase family
MRRRSWLGDFARQTWLRLSVPRPAGPSAADVAAALAVIDPSPPPTDDPERPIFLLATGWRTGSGLMQRILGTDPSVFLWGEPFGRLALVPRLAEAVRAFDGDWPAKGIWCPDAGPDHHSAAEWVTTQFPPGKDFRAAVRQFLLTWWVEPARRTGQHRWGIKDVRLGAAEAALLQWAFPCAAFVVLTRHPYAAYRSASRANPPRHAWDMYARWPNRPIEGAAPFARHWDALASSWIGSDVRYSLVKYEDVISGTFDFRKLESNLGLKLNERAALAVNIGGTPDRSPLRSYERAIVGSNAKRGMKAFHYDNSTA